jgi:hypothetical protein
MGIAASDCSGTVWDVARLTGIPALSRGGKEHAAARQKHSLNSNAWMDYTPVWDMKTYETVPSWLSRERLTARIRAAHPRYGGLSDEQLRGIAPRMPPPVIPTGGWS